MKSRIALVAVVLSALAAAVPANASGSTFPETSSLQSDLLEAKTTLMSLATRTRRAEKTTENARKTVEQASNVVRTVDQIDDLLIRVIRQLEPVSKLPPTRTMRPLVLNLKKLQSEVHKARVKGDNVQKKVLAPMRTRLTQMERVLEKAIVEIDQAARETDQARQHVVKLRDFVDTRDNANEVAALESLSKGARAAIRPLTAGLKAIDDASRGAENDLNGLTKALSPLTATGPGLANLQKKLTPVDNTARDLDKVLNKRIAVKVFKKSVGFTVRQVIEGPGKVADIFLKPLEKLASKALSPVMRKFKLEIPTPREITAISNSLDAVASQLTSVTASANRLETALQNTGVSGLRGSLGALIAKTPAQLANRR